MVGFLFVFLVIRVFAKTGFRIYSSLCVLLLFMWRILDLIELVFHVKISDCFESAQYMYYQDSTINL